MNKNQLTSFEHMQCSHDSQKMEVSWSQDFPKLNKIAQIGMHSVISIYIKIIRKAMIMRRWQHD